MAATVPQLRIDPLLFEHDSFVPTLKQGHKNLCVIWQNTSIRTKTDTGLPYCNTGVEIIFSVKNGSDSFIYSRRHDLRFSCLRGHFIGPLSGSLKTKDLHNNTPFSQLESQVGMLWQPSHFRVPPANPCGFRTWSLFTNRMHNLELYITWTACHKQHHRCP
jgi:hypothetical protein